MGEAARSDGCAKPPLRVLVISQFFWPEAFRINQVVEDLRAAGADVTVLSGQPNYPEGRIFAGYSALAAGFERHPSGYDIARVPIVPRGGGGALRLGLNYLSFILSGILVGTLLLSRRRFDVLFVYGTSPIIQGFVGTWLKWLKRAKLVLWVQDLWPQALSATGHVKSPVLLRLVAAAVARLYRSADLLLGQSHAFIPAIRALAGKTDVRYFPNPGEHDPRSAASSAPELPPSFAVVFAGNLGRVQALDTVIDAADRLRHHHGIHFALFGSGSMGDRLASEAQARDLPNVKLYGRLPAEAMPGVYEQASALLLTLVKDELLARTIPSKLQSYLKAGKPIIAAVDGEAGRIVQESGGGLVCEPESGGALAETVLALAATSEEERASMGDAARHYYHRHYEPKALAAELCRTLTQVASGELAPLAGRD